MSFRSRGRRDAARPSLSEPASRRARRSVANVLGIATATAGLLVFAPAAVAGPACTPAANDIITPSCFEGGDGNLVTDNADGVGRFDWSTMAGIVGAPITFADDTLDSQFAGGNAGKEQSPGDWVLNTGNVSNKTDLAAAAVKSDPVSNDIFFYGAFARPIPNGDANLSFELNKVGGRWDLNAPGGPVPDPDGVPYRSNGDILLTFDGNSGNVEVGICKWFGGPEVGYNGYLGQTVDASYGWKLLDGSALGSSCTELSTVSLATRTAQGAMNPVTLNNVDTVLPSFPATLPADGFGEVSVNISQALTTLADPNPCFSFGSVWLHSRASSSASANMEDFVAPVDLVGASTCSIAVDKTVAVNNGPDRQVGNGTTFTADPSWANPGDTLNYEIRVTNDGQETVALQTPTDPNCDAAPSIVDADKTQTANPVGPDLSPASFDPGDTWTYRCSDLVPAGATAPITNTVTVNGTVGVAPQPIKNLSGTDSTKTAIKARLFVRKVNVGGDPADVFDFTTSPDLVPAAFTLVGGAQREYADLLPNSGADATTNVYTVTEAAETGYDLTGVVCRTGPGANDPVAAGTSVNGATATVLLTQGQSQYCTYTNTRRASVTIIKDADPADGTDFAFGGSFGAFSLDEGGVADGTPTQRTFDVAAADLGTKSVSELGETGWQLTDIACNTAAEASNESLAGIGGSTDIKVDAGDVITCTFVNKKDATITIVKDADPADGTDFDFTSTIPGLAAFDLADGEDATITTGDFTTRTVTELAEQDWQLTDIACNADADASGETLAGDGGATDIKVDPGDAITCTFVNKKNATVTVIKDAEPADGTDFDFSGSFGAFALDEGGAADATPTSRDFTVGGTDFGSKTLTETGLAGWQLTDIACNPAAGATGEDLAGNGGTTDIQVDPGDAITCTFVNKKSGSLTIVKDAEPDDAQDFTFTGDGVIPAGAFLLDDDADGTLAASRTFANLDTFGPATVAETQVNGWDLEQIACVDAQNAPVAVVRYGDIVGNAFTTGAADASRDGFDAGDTAVEVDVQPGVDATCTFTNKKVALNVAKVGVQVQPVNAGETVAFDITTSNQGPGIARDVVTTDPLPPEVTWAIQPAGTDATSLAACTITGAPGAQVLECTYGDIAAAGSFTVRVEATTGTTAQDCKQFDNTATVVADNAPTAQSSASVSCNLPNVTIAKSTATPAITGGDVAMFAVKITNLGPGTAKDVVVEDLLPAGLTWTADGALPAGCAIANVIVAQQQRQKVTCSFVAFGVASVTFNVKATTTVTACATYVNTATLTGSNIPGGNSAATIVCTKPNPTIDIDKTGPGSATAGQTLPFVINVTNTGVVPFPAAQVKVTDDRCDAGTLVQTGKNGDATPGTLDPNDTWSYACTIATAPGQTAVTNVATVAGVDVNGKPASATDDATTTLVQPVVPVVAADTVPPPPPAAVASEVIIPGSARINGVSGCVKGARSRFYITGRQISSVRFVMDGRTMKTVRKADKQGRWMLTVTNRTLKRGTHRVRAVVSFRAASRTRTRTLQVRFTRCVSRVRAERVRGLTG